MARRPSVEHVRNVPLFRGCSQKDLEKVVRAGDEISRPAGTTLVREGEPGHDAFIVLDGSVSVHRAGAKVTTLGPGSIVGELSMLDRGPRTATVVCETDCDLFVLGVRQFSGVLEEVPSIAHSLLASLATRIREGQTQQHFPG